MMSSGTSTDSPSFRPWHVFTVTALLGATAAIVVTKPPNVIILVLICLTVGSAGLVGLMTYRTLRPLTQKEHRETAAMAGSRTRAAVEREKTLVLRSLKELEFDRAMSKVSEKDFHEMASRLRARALSLMKQLDIETPGYRDLIERELEARLEQSTVDSQPSTVDSPPSTVEGQWSRVERRTGSPSTCSECGTANDQDARFCKGCGSALL